MSDPSERPRSLVVPVTAPGSLPPQGAALAEKLIRLIKKDVQAAPELLTPPLVTHVLIKVLTGHVATCRVTTKSKVEVASNLIGSVFADYLQAHDHIVCIESKNNPGG